MICNPWWTGLGASALWVPMAIPRGNRPGDRQGPSSTLIILGSVLVGTLLVAVWVMSSPAAIPEDGESVRNTEGPVELPDRTPSEVPDNTEKESLAEDTPSDVKEKESPEEETPSDAVDTTEKETPTEKTPATEEDPVPTTTTEPTPTTTTEPTSETEERNATKFETQVQESNEERGTTENPALRETVDEVAEWKLCSFEGAQDYIPCLDNKDAIKKLTTTAHYEHRERHCPTEEELPKCLLPLPAGYKVPVKWPASRDAVWFSNVPHTELASYKSDQNWVKVSGDKQKLIFPGGGTQFKTEGGALHYIEYIQKVVPEISWGKHIRVVLDVGCGVASFGGYLFEKDVLTMSLAPKDEHEAQIQFALERGIPAISGVMGTQRLVFPSNVYDVVHCARCRVPWEKEGGMLMLELNRLLRPGGFFVWSATPVYWDDEEDVKIWEDTSALLKRMQWKMLTRSVDPDTKVGVAIFQKPSDNTLYDQREDALPPFCESDDKPDAAWYVPMKACMHKIPTGEGARATTWPPEWPVRVESMPFWLNSTAKDFQADAAHWKLAVEKSYIQGSDIDWNSVRKVMDMNAGYGGLAAALVSYPLWVMNIVPITEPDTLPIIFDRGLIGMYHDWCEPHSTYPRSYDVMHSNHLLSTLKKRCKTETVLMEMDRILRPDGWAIFRDSADTMIKVEAIVKSLHWDIVLSSADGDSRLLVAQKRFWRPDTSL